MLALVQAPQTFKTTDMFRGVVFVTTPQNTWIERTKNDLSVALTEEVLPIAANLATLALVGLDLTDIARRQMRFHCKLGNSDFIATNVVSCNIAIHSEFD